MTFSLDRPKPITQPLRHNGPCGTREACWRPDCRAAFPGLRTVEVLPDGERLCYCHRSRFYPRGYRAEVAA